MYTIIRYGVDHHNYWIRIWPDLSRTQSLNHAIKPILQYLASILQYPFGTKPSNLMTLPAMYEILTCALKERKFA